MCKPIARWLLPCLLLLVDAHPLTAQPRSTQRITSFSMHQETPNKLYVISPGDAEQQAARITVFEVLGPGCKLRRLHHMELATLSMPSLGLLLADGRFLVTMQNWVEQGDAREHEYVLAIYDLVRKEQTTYRLADILSQEQIANLQYNDSGLGGDCWFGEGFPYIWWVTERFYDSERFELRIPLETQPYSEVKIDLVTRSIDVVEGGTPIDKPSVPPFLDWNFNIRDIGGQFSEESWSKWGLPTEIQLNRRSPPEVRYFMLDMGSGEYVETLPKEQRVSQINTAPVARDIHKQVYAGVKSVLHVRSELEKMSRGAPDESFQTLVMSRKLSDPSVGEIRSFGDTSFTYFAPPSSVGTTSFQFEVIDNGTTNGNPDAKTATATCTIEILPVPVRDSVP